MQLHLNKTTEIQGRARLGLLALLLVEVLFYSSFHLVLSCYALSLLLFVMIDACGWPLLGMLARALKNPKKISYVNLEWVGWGTSSTPLHKCGCGLYDMIDKRRHAFILLRCSRGKCLFYSPSQAGPPSWHPLLFAVFEPQVSFFCPWAHLLVNFLWWVLGWWDYVLCWFPWGLGAYCLLEWIALLYFTPSLPTDLRLS